MHFRKIDRISGRYKRDVAARSILEISLIVKKVEKILLTMTCSGSFKNDILNDLSKLTIRIHVSSDCHILETMLRLTKSFFLLFLLERCYSKKRYAYYDPGCVADFFAGMNRPLHTLEAKKFKEPLDISYRFFIFVHSFPPTKKRLRDMLASIQSQLDYGVDVYNVCDRKIAFSCCERRKATNFAFS